MAVIVVKEGVKKLSEVIKSVIAASDIDLLVSFFVSFSYEDNYQNHNIETYIETNSLNFGNNISLKNSLEGVEYIINDCIIEYSKFNDTVILVP